ncbi:MAG: dienelactone hydrolase [Cellulomonas sp.]|uniref:Alpha/beta hydrolase n=1 Tax=Cellulomonas gelida TaxID=1712 RepID=A0A4Y3KRL1_9CELL|nr:MULTISPECIES: alpha/beta family hydrolase [Cellulomonas]KMM46613.1 dienelactone hydrolase [Cellulomonas sp. A375-1]MCR6648673.1 dienelactone hydrolase [Cellulomonas sp.]MCR6704632.1 dienelactone hydrolase [Cellulomonas sp.]GEA86024.1 alpha/beta hydrolase [Cellulomonas gelida]
MAPAGRGGRLVDPQDVAGVLLTPGASADRDHHTLVALEAALAPLPVLRMHFANRERGNPGPERAEAAIPYLRERADAWAAELGVEPGRLVLGGRSFGGRMASMAVAQGQPAAGLLLLSYPLHPPGKPDTLRIEHLPDVDVPTLAVSGQRDPFGTPDELAHHLAAIPGPLRLVTVPGDHSPADPPVVAAVLDWFGRSPA